MCLPNGYRSCRTDGHSPSGVMRNFADAGRTPRVFHGVDDEVDDLSPVDDLTGELFQLHVAAHAGISFAWTWTIRRGTGAGIPCSMNAW